MPSLLQKFYDRVYPRSTEPDLSTASTQLEAQAAVKSAEKAYKTAVKNDPQITRVVSALRDQRERNHFAEMLEITMRGNG